LWLGANWLGANQMTGNQRICFIPLRQKDE